MVAGQAQEVRFPCESCGAQLTYRPGSEVIACAHCGHENPVEPGQEGPWGRAAQADALVERDLAAVLKELAGQAPLEERRSVACQNCGAVFDLDSDVHAEACPYCGTAVVADPAARRRIAPQGLIPFVQPGKAAQAALKSWIEGLWFAPSDLKAYARSEGRLGGVYLPFWTFDCDSDSRYSGLRGRAVYTSRNVTVMVKGKPRSRRQQVRTIRWTPVAGQVSRHFDDVLVSAGGAVPEELLDGIGPWDLTALTAYREEYLSGFRSELYRSGLEQGFQTAQGIMKATIREDVRRDIGGDTQQIRQIQSRFDNIGFKHILLPVWAAAYSYRGRSFPFVVNGQSGKVSGARPYSPLKIAAAVAAALLLAGGALLLYLADQGQLRVPWS